MAGYLPIVKLVSNNMDEIEVAYGGEVCNGEIAGLRIFMKSCSNEPEGDFTEVLLVCKQDNGTKLKDIKKINSAMEMVFDDRLKLLHKIIFNNVVSLQNTKNNLKEFDGLNSKRDSPEYDRVLSKLIRSEGKTLKRFCKTLQLKPSDTHIGMAMTVLDFLMNPSKEATMSNSPLLPNRKCKTCKPKKQRRSIEPKEEEVDQPAGPHPVLMIAEVLTIIFGFLSTRNMGRVARVCRTWRDSAYTKHLWRHVVADWRPYEKNPTLVSSFVKRGISQWRVLDHQHRFKFVMDTSDISSVDLRGWASITNLDVRKVLGQIGKPRSLRITSSEITDELMFYLAIKVPTLLNLDLTDCTKITDDGIQELIQRPPGDVRLQLESLSVNCKNITDDSLRRLQLDMPSLKSLCLRGSRFTDRGVEYLSQMANLEELDLSYNRGWNSEVKFDSLVNGSAKLVKLVVVECSFVNDAMLKVLAEIPTLRVLNLSDNDGVSDGGLAHLVAGKSMVEHLNLANCQTVTNVGLKHLSKLDGLNSLTFLV